ncbi:MAG: hypothetical protein LBM96_00695 [Methanobrevibacter sp.]|jgi:hypothetical protein|nr:hypothetical protein [Candidatus Methanoflexus mossambicus]
MSLYSSVQEIKTKISTILTTIAEANEVGSIIFGPKSSTGKIKGNKFFRVLFEEMESESKTVRGRYKLSFPIRITANVNAKNVEDGGMESIRLISILADELFVNEKLNDIDGVNDIEFDRLLVDYPFNTSSVNQQGSGLRFIIKLSFNSLCDEEIIE